MRSGYTVLRLNPSSAIPLFEGHVRRLGEASRGALRQFASRGEAGVYRVTWDGAQLSTTLRPASRLVEGMPTRFVVSPFAGQRGRFQKPAPPSPYDDVRIAGVASLLTDAAGEEIFESCSASVVAWDGSSLVLPLDEVPAVASLAEAQVAARLSPRRARVLVASEWPVLLINAVVGTCSVSIEGRAGFPADQRALLEGVLASEG